MRTSLSLTPQDVVIMTLPADTMATLRVHQTQTLRRRSHGHLQIPLEVEASLGRHLASALKAAPKRSTIVTSNLGVYSKRCCEKKEWQKAQKTNQQVSSGVSSEG